MIRLFFIEQDIARATNKQKFPMQTNTGHWTLLMGTRIALNLTSHQTRSMNFQLWEVSKCRYPSSARNGCWCWLDDKVWKYLPLHLHLRSRQQT